MNILVRMAGGVPNPTPVAPPGADKFFTMLNWGYWVALALCVGGLIIVGVRFAIAMRNGEGSETAKSLGLVMFGIIIVISASSLVKFLM